MISGLIKSTNYSCNVEFLHFEHSIWPAIFALRGELGRTFDIHRCYRKTRIILNKFYNQETMRFIRSFYNIFLYYKTLSLRRPLRKKLRMRWFFDVSEVKESSFLKSDLTDPPSDFWCASFGKYQFRPFFMIVQKRKFDLKGCSMTAILYTWEIRE